MAMGLRGKGARDGLPRVTLAPLATAFAAPRAIHDCGVDQPPPSALYKVTPLLSRARRVPISVWRALYQVRCASSTSR